MRRKKKDLTSRLSALTNQIGKIINLFNIKSYKSTTILDRQLRDFNNQLHRMLDMIEKVHDTNTTRSLFLNSLFNIQEILENLERKSHEILIKINDKPKVAAQIKSILQWIKVSLVKLTTKVQSDKYTSEDLHDLLKFIYESTWKLIIIFEDILHVDCPRCKKYGRIVIYSNFFKKDITQAQQLLEQSRIIEQDIIKQIKQLDK